MFKNKVIQSKLTFVVLLVRAVGLQHRRNWNCVSHDMVAHHDRLADELVECVAGWLAGPLAGWLAGWLADWLAGWLGGWLTGWQTHLLADWLALCLSVAQIYDSPVAELEALLNAIDIYACNVQLYLLWLQTFTTPYPHFVCMRYRIYTDDNEI